MGRQDDSIAAREFIAQTFRDVRYGMTIAEIFLYQRSRHQRVPGNLIEDRGSHTGTMAKRTIVRYWKRRQVTRVIRL